MADLSFGQPVGLPKQEQGTKLSDLVGTATGILQYQKMAELYPEMIAKTKAEAKLTQTAADTAEFENMNKRVTNIIQDQQRLLDKPDLTSDDIVDAVKYHAKQAKDPEAAVNQALAGLPVGGSKPELKAWLAQGLAKTLSAQSQLEKLYPTPSAVSTGQETKFVAPGNQLLSGIAPGTQQGVGIQQQLPPTTPVVTPSGAPGYLGAAGGGGGGGGGAPAQGGIQTRSPSGQVLSGFAPGQEQNIIGGQKEYTNTLNYATSEVPRSLNINQRVMSLLDDPEVNTGPVTKAMSGKFKNVTLNSKEQELVKYLEQRIQSANVKSDADAESKRNAFGNLGLDKKALKDIITLDNANLAGDKLYSQGMQRAVGDPNNPNFAAVNAYKQKWEKVADPEVFRFMNSVGDNPAKPNNPEDAAKIQQMLSKMNLRQRQEFANKRKEILRLVNEGQ